MSWWADNPGRLQREISEVQRRYPEMHLCHRALEAGTLALQGSLTLRSKEGATGFPVSLIYPDEFPYLYPQVVPLIDEAPEEATVADLMDRERVRFFSARHQMASGALCLYEAPHAAGAPVDVSGVDALKRAELWLRYAIRGQVPPGLDSAEAALEDHYERRGDILLGPSMARTDLPARGRFLAVRLREGELSLFGVTHVEHENGGYEDIELLSRVHPGLTEVLGEVLGGDSKKVHSIEGLVADPRALVGRWFTVDREPLPIRSMSDLARTIFQGEESPIGLLNQTFAIERHTLADVVVAVRYPAREQSSWDWLMLHVKLRAHALPTQRDPDSGREVPLIGFGGDAARSWEEADYGALRCHDLRRPKLELRNRGAVPCSVGDLSVGLLGAGALGSQCGDLLAKAGVKSLAIWDNGVLDAGNAIRHSAPIACTGLPKAGLVGGAVAAHNPHCDVDCQGSSVLAAMRSGDSEIWKPDVLLSTIAEDATELAFSAQAVRQGVTVYYLRALRRGEAGRLIRVGGNNDACMECIGRYHRDADPRAIIVGPTTDEVVARECGQAILAASAADLAVVGGAGVRLLLQDVTNPGSANQWVWTITGIPDLAGLERPFSMRSATLPTHPECSVCSRGEVRRVTLPVAVRDKLLQLTAEHSPSETGGILIGRRNGQVVEVVDASDAGPNAESSPYRFERDGPYCQRYLEAVVEAQDAGVDYVGDWHSHPGSSNQPSLRDILSMSAIAADPDYLTESPVMLIVGQNDDTVAVGATLVEPGRRLRSLELAIHE